MKLHEKGQIIRTATQIHVYCIAFRNFILANKGNFAVQKHTKKILNECFGVLLLEATEIGL